MTEKEIKEIDAPGVEVPPDLQGTVTMTTLERILNAGVGAVDTVYNVGRRFSVWPMFSTALRRRSPAMSWNLPLGIGRTITGCNKPWFLMISASSLSASSSKLFRGWFGFVLISSVGTNMRR